MALLAVRTDSSKSHPLDPWLTSSTYLISLDPTLTWPNAQKGSKRTSGREGSAMSGITISSPSTATTNDEWMPCASSASV